MNNNIRHNNFLKPEGIAMLGFKPDVVIDQINLKYSTLPPKKRTAQFVRRVVRNMEDDGRSITDATIYNYLNGRFKPNPDVLPYFANELGCSIDKFFGWKAVN